MGSPLADVACQATPVGVDNSVGAVAPIEDRNPRDVAVQGAVPLLISTLVVQTDRQVVAVATTKPSYALVATQATPVPTSPMNGTSNGPPGGAGPYSVGAWALVVHGVLTRISVDEIFWHAD